MARYIPRLLSEPSYILRSSCENNLTSAVLITLCKPADGPESWNQWRGEIDRRLRMASPCDLNAGSANRAAMAPTRSDTRQTTPHQPILETTQAVTDCIWLRMAYTSDNNNTQNYSQASLLISLYIFNTKTRLTIIAERRRTDYTSCILMNIIVNIHDLSWLRNKISK